MVARASIPSAVVLVAFGMAAPALAAPPYGHRPPAAWYRHDHRPTGYHPWVYGPPPVFVAPPGPYYGAPPPVYYAPSPGLNFSFSIP